MQEGNRRTYRSARRPGVDAEEMSAARVLRSRSLERRGVLHKVTVVHKTGNDAVSLRDESRTRLPRRLRLV